MCHWWTHDFAHTYVMAERSSGKIRLMSDFVLMDDGSHQNDSGELEVLGWREYVELPHLHGFRVKAKVDTGARTSALHARKLRFEETSSGVNAQFALGSGDDAISVSAKVIEHRLVRSSNGQDDLRPVILTPITVLGQTWHAEVTLSDRELMGFPMLLGRSAIRNRFLVDPNRSFCGGV